MKRSNYPQPTALHANDNPRRTGQVLLILWLCWIVAACIEWRAQH
ncbi:unnamed protein product, partial [Ectocarpus sp. 13 AM-2016]